MDQTMRNRLGNYSHMFTSCNTFRQHLCWGFSSSRSTLCRLLFYVWERERERERERALAPVENLNSSFRYILQRIFSKSIFLEFLNNQWINHAKWGKLFCLLNKLEAWIDSIYIDKLTRVTNDLWTQAPLQYSNQSPPYTPSL